MIKSHKIQGTKLKQLQHFLSQNKANIKHSCKSQLHNINSNKNQTETLRERDTTCDGKLKNTTPKRMNTKQSFKNHNDSSI